MKEKLAKFDKGFARGEAALAVIVLLSLVLVAAVQALLRNLADAEVAWATSALADVGWVDAFMQRATLWLAMLGASLATHYDKHIGIDILARIAKPKARALMRGTVALFASITSFYFARVVLGALLAKAVRIPGDYAVYDENFESIHICVGTAEQISNASLERPDFFCGVRSFLDGLGLAVNTPERAMDLVVPAMFVIIAVRFFAIGVNAFSKVSTGGIPDHEMGGADRHEGKDAASAADVPVDEGDDALGGESDSEDPSADHTDAGSGEGSDSDDSDDDDSSDSDDDAPKAKSKKKKRKNKKGGRR